LGFCFKDVCGAEASKNLADRHSSKVMSASKRRDFAHDAEPAPSSPYYVLREYIGLIIVIPANTTTDWTAVLRRRSIYGLDGKTYRGGEEIRAFDKKC
jgi:hypothetical protein